MHILPTLEGGGHLLCTSCMKSCPHWGAGHLLCTSCQHWETGAPSVNILPTLGDRGTVCAYPAHTEGEGIFCAHPAHTGGTEAPSVHIMPFKSLPTSAGLMGFALSHRFIICTRLFSSLLKIGRQLIMSCICKKSENNMAVQSMHLRHVAASFLKDLYDVYWKKCDWHRR